MKFGKDRMKPFGLVKKLLMLLFFCIMNFNSSTSFFDNEGIIMSLMKWHNELKDFFDQPIEFKLNSQSFDLSTDMYADDGNVIIKMNVPGIDADDIHIRVHDDHLHVSGNRTEKQEEKEKTYYHKEMKSGSFECKLSLPCPVDESAIDASLSHGVLTIKLPKVAKEEHQPKRIKVRRE